LPLSWLAHIGFFGKRTRGFLSNPMTGPSET